jgi:hypothetical protein
MTAAEWWVRKRSKRRSKRLLSVARSGPEASAERLEAQREALLSRLTRVHTAARHRPGYRTALNLLNPTFRKANLAARAAILQAASFMIDILERMPPL